MRKLLLITIVALISSCEKPAESSQTHGNFKVELLFEKDGCKMYRFMDSRYVYWCNCEGKIQSDIQQKNNTVHEETIITK